MDRNGKSIEVRSQKSEVREQVTGNREQSGKTKRFFTVPYSLFPVPLLLALLFSPGARAQFNSGSTGALGNFLNPLAINVPLALPPDFCNYDLLQIDLAQGKVFVRPFQNGVGNNCNSTALVDITSQFPNFPAAGGFPDGVLDVGNFTLQRPALAGATAPIFRMEFLPNAKNTPVIIRATGNVDIQGNTTLKVEGQPGTVNNGLLRGQGGAGGPGGYRGGDGGNGGANPSAGAPGFGPGGSAGGAAGASASSPAAKFLTTNKTVAGVVIPTGNDLLSLLRGGSGGGGGGGDSSRAGYAGGGGGGAILIAATGTITVSGTLTAAGGVSPGGCAATNGGAGGSGGAIRLVASTIAGSGPITVAGGNPCDGAPTGENGMIRLEALTISYSGSLTGEVQAASTPGGVIIPSVTPPAFIRFASITDTNNPSNTTGSISAASQIFGQTGGLNPTSVTMPNLSGILPTSVKVIIAAGPSGFPANKNIVLVVTPIDPFGGPPVTRNALTICPTPTTCTAEFLSVPLPPGVSSMNAFAVLTLSGSGVLARMFPPIYEGEPIESVRVQTNDKGTEYVLIAKSGKEFPYKPGR